MEGGRGAYHFRCEMTAIGEDIGILKDTDVDRDTLLRCLMEELKNMTPEQIEADVYQQWQGTLCRPCRTELAEALNLFFNRT
ncbi:hypothetical protein KKA00_06105 [bacterium]|nr:hypothetical protein [bacterium]MBU1651772.1 hypothetical protein [bacterium]